MPQVQELGSSSALSQTPNIGQAPEKDLNEQKSQICVPITSQLLFEFNASAVSQNLNQTKSVRKD